MSSASNPDVGLDLLVEYCENGSISVALSTFRFCLQWTGGSADLLESMQDHLSVAPSPSEERRLRVGTVFGVDLWLQSYRGFQFKVLGGDEDGAHHLLEVSMTADEVAALTDALMLELSGDP